MSATIKPLEARSLFRLPLIFFLAFAVLLSSMAVLKYLSLHSTIADLGFFLNNFYNDSSGAWWRKWQGHIQPFIPVWSLLYLAFPGEVVPVVLVLLQACLLAAPVYFLCRYYGWLPAVAYVLYFPLWFNALFDFHFDHLVVPLLFAFFFFEQRGKIGLAVISALALLLVKEPFALQTVACGIYLILFSRQFLFGSILIGVGIFWFYVSVNMILPYYSMGTGGNLDSAAFSWMGNGLVDKLTFMMTHPLIVLGNILVKEKLIYLTLIFGALGFIPLLRPDILLVSLPILSISLLSASGNYHGVDNHYTAGLIAPLMIAFAESLPRARSIWSWIKFPRGLFTGLLLTGLFTVHFLNSPSPLGKLFWFQQTWPYHWTVFWPTERDAMIKRAITKYIPTDPDVVVSSQNTLNWEPLSRRKYFFPFPIGVFEPYGVIHKDNREGKDFREFVTKGKFIAPEIKKFPADFIVLDLKRPWFVVDRGCLWAHGKCQNNEKVAREYLNLVEKTRNTHRMIFEEDGFLIFSRLRGKDDVG